MRTFGSEKPHGTSCQIIVRFLRKDHEDNSFKMMQMCELRDMYKLFYDAYDAIILRILY